MKFLQGPAHSLYRKR